MTPSVAAKEGVRFGPGPRLSAPGADLRVELTGYLQADFRSFPNWQAIGSRGNLAGDVSEIRRLRTGVDGQWRRVSFEVDVDLSDTRNHLKDAYADLRLSKRLRIRGGHFKLPLSREHLMSAARTDFVERSQLATSVAPGRDFGVMLHGELRKTLSYQAGVFAGDGRTRDERARTTAALRLIAKPRDDLELGVASTLGFVAADPEEPGVQIRAKGFRGLGPSGYEFFRPHYVHGWRLRLGLEASYSRGPVALKAEALQSHEQRRGQGLLFEDLPDLRTRSWVVSGTWLLAGERKNRGVRPRHPPFKGLGALEVGLRFESLRFEDTGPATEFPSGGRRAGDVRSAADRAFTGGLSWWPTPWLRLTGNVIVERFQDPLFAPEPDRLGDYVTLVGRLQLQLP